MNGMNLNDILQWGAVIALLVIIALIMVRKIMRLRHNAGSDAGDCSCGCGSCKVDDCSLKEIKSKHKRRPR